MIEPGRWVELAGIEPRPRWTRRLYLFTAIVLIGVTVLSWRLVELQVIQGAGFNRLALINRIHRLTVEAERGVIYDRHGLQLAFNDPAWSLQVTPVGLPDDRGGRAAEYQQLARLSGRTAADIGLAVAADLDPYRPLTIKAGLTQQEAETAQERLPELPGARLDQVPVRRYADPEIYSHVLGYTGRIDGEAYKQLRGSGYLPDESIGRAGVEAGLEDVLRGRNGWEDVETDANGVVKQVLALQAPVAGRSVYLSLDGALQKEAYGRLQEGLAKANSKAGAIVATDPRDGEVLALVSYPGYDANAFAAGITQAAYDKLLADPGKPLYDRAIAGLYPPGSTFKMITGTAGLEEGKITPSTLLGCPSHLSFGAWTYWNWARYDFGLMNVLKAIPTSCDTFFYQVADRLGPDALAAYARAFGYGAVPGIEIPGAQAGVAPNPDYKQSICATPGSPECSWNEGDTVTMGIGQSYVLATPLIQAMYAATMGNSGTLLRPTIVHKVTDGAGTLLTSAQPAVVRQVPISPANLEVLRQGMNQCLNGPWGTAAIARVLGFRWDGGCKTGTAQFGGTGVDLPSHAWFVDFGPYNTPTFASATLLENGGFGEYTAEPVAVNVLDYYFDHRGQINLDG